ncbi:transcription termination/antitermination protein NusG [Ricinus communis]|nr:transcription termination/antitermination protein NusG [Ricinus communis]XP_048226145.1 transcription termination/antitermination protein NusG [Ricinus communis]
MIKQGLLQWSSSPLISLQIPRTRNPFSPIKATIESASTRELTARERRQLRQERRESKAGYSWREEVEERLIKKPKKVKLTAGEARNLDNLADLGPQWYAVRVSRVRGDQTAELIARLLARHYPHLEFKVYAPSVKVKTKLKNGTYSIKSKPIYPGCVFLWCVLNKELHDFVREECAGVGGFIGSKVGNNKRQINRPRPVSVEDMEEIFREAKEEQEKYDREFEEEQQKEGVPNSLKLADDDVTKLVTDSKSTRGFQKVSDSPANDSPRKKTSKLPTAGSTVRVVSGTFAEFVGTLKKLNRKTGKATVGFTLFGKETLIELDRREIVAENE